MKTCTFDPLTHKVVPIEPTNETLEWACLNQSDMPYETYAEWANSHSSGVVDMIRGFIRSDYQSMIAAAPEYPADAKVIHSFIEMQSEECPYKKAYYIDLPDIYCDIEKDKDGKWSVFFRERSTKESVYSELSGSHADIVKPMAWYLPDIKMVTTSETERDRWTNAGREVVVLVAIISAPNPTL